MTIRKLFHPGNAGTLFVTALVCAAVLAPVACARRQRDASKVNAISETAPQVRPIPKSEKILANKRVLSQGECAPKYANGQVGTCIEGKSCRGLGMRDEAGAAICSCFGKVGGCEAGSRCDAVKQRCVPETEPTRERAP